MRQVSSFLQPPASRPDPPGKVPEKTNCSEKSLLCSGKWEKWRKRNFFFVLSCRLALSPPSSPYSLNCDSKQVGEEGKSFPKWFKTSPSISTDDDIMVREQTTFLSLRAILGWSRFDHLQPDLKQTFNNTRKTGNSKKSWCNNCQLSTAARKSKFFRFPPRYNDDMWKMLTIQFPILPAKISLSIKLRGKSLFYFATGDMWKLFAGSSRSMSLSHAFDVLEAKHVCCMNMTKIFLT